MEVFLFLQNLFLMDLKTEVEVFRLLGLEVVIRAPQPVERSREIISNCYFFHH